MVTFKPVVFHQVKPKNGAYNVKIRVTYKGVSRFLPTTLYCTQSDLTRQGKIKPSNTLTKGNELCDRMRETLADVSPFTLESKDVDWVVQHIKNSLQVEKFSLDFFEWADVAMQTKKEATRRIYQLTVNSFRRFIGDSIDINDITASMIKDFIAWVNSTPIYKSNGRGKTGSSAGDMMHSAGAGERMTKYLSNIYKMAQERYNDEDAGKILIPRHPFSRVKHTLPPASKGQHSVGTDIIQMLIDYVPESDRERGARDYFLISFLLMGANVADLYKALPPVGGVWEYNRAKTQERRADNARMRVYVPDVVLPYIDRHKDMTGKHWMDCSRNFSGTASMTNSINEGLKSICAKCGLHKFTMYAARKSWATIARQLGVEKATIDECLCHVGEFRVADIYIEKNWDIINAANAKVISQFRW